MARSWIQCCICPNAKYPGAQVQVTIYLGANVRLDKLWKCKNYPNTHDNANKNTINRKCIYMKAEML